MHTTAESASTQSRLKRDELRAVFEHASVGIAVTALDGHFVETNPRFREILGYSPEQLAGRTFIETTHPDDVAATRSRIRDLLDGRIRSYTLEKRYVRADGTSVWCNVSVTLLRADDGAPLQFIGVVEDISHRKDAEDARDHLASVVEFSADAIITKTLDGIITTWNPGAERTFGYTASEVIGKPITILIPPDRLDEESTILARLHRGERIEHYETVRRRKDGSLIDISLSVSPLKDASGHIVGASKIARDITLQKRVEEELRAQTEMLRTMDQRKDEFLATLAHELRNPLAPIKQAAVICAASAASAEQKAWATSVIRRQVEHMSLLLDDLLDVSRITRGTLDLRVVMTDLRTVVNAAIETSQPLLDDRGHRFIVDLPHGTTRFAADPLRLAQVLSNLLTNAAKYTDAGGCIRLVAQADDSLVTLRVEDNGIGIAPGAMSHIFRMFSQGTEAHRRSEGGLGIGLALARGLTELHGGTLRVESAGVGLGSAFTVSIPRRTLGTSQRIPESQTPASRGISRRVLIADDNRDAADSLALLLRMEGHEVTVAHDGAGAWRMIKSSPPEVAILDIGMPELDGYEVAQRVRETPSMKNLVLIAVTGWGQETDVARSRMAGFDHHFTKPIEPAQLTALLASQ